MRVRRCVSSAGERRPRVAIEREKPKKGVFNTEEIVDLLARFEGSSLSEMRLRSGEVELLFRRGSPALMQLAQLPSAHFPTPIAPSAPHTGTASGPADRVAAAPSAASQAGTEIITSPLVGTFYRSPAPDAPPFVERGGTAKKGQTLCILEAMKLMNELEAEFDCEVVAILVENGKMVEFGTPLLEVRRI